MGQVKQIEIEVQNMQRGLSAGINQFFNKYGKEFTKSLIKGLEGEIKRKKTNLGIN